MNIGDRIDQCGLAGCFFNFGQSSNRPLNFFERCLPVAVHTFVGSVDAYLQTATSLRQGGTKHWLAVICGLGAHGKAG